MKLPKELMDAYAAVDKHIDTALAENNKMELERIELQKLSQSELIDIILKAKYSATKGKRCINVEALAYAILEDPICTYLTYDMIETAIQSREIPGLQTKAGNLRWYASKGLEKCRDVAPRATKSAIQSLIAKAIAGGEE